jgi:uncharacterized protein YebE (UPF0316 family)
MDFSFILDERVLFFLIPLLIFLFRIVDVSLGTVRIILASKGIKKIAAIISFFEVLIWIIAISQILKNLNNFLAYIAYAAGFALGTYIGVIIEEKISIGKVRVRIITKKNLKKIIDDLPHTRYVFISDSVESSEGKIKIINAFLDRKNLKEVLGKIKELDSGAFYTVEDLRIIKNSKEKISNLEIRHYHHKNLKK